MEYHSFSNIYYWHIMHIQYVLEEKKNQSDTMGDTPIIVKSPWRSTVADSQVAHDTLKYKGNACTKYDKRSTSESMSQNTGLFFTICNLYSTKKCCRWIFIAPSFSSNLRNFTLRALSFMSEGSVLVFTENNSLFGVVCQHVQGQSADKLLIWVCLPPSLTRSMTSGGIFLP